MAGLHERPPVYNNSSTSLNSWRTRSSSQNRTTASAHSTESINTSSTGSTTNSSNMSSSSGSNNFQSSSALSSSRHTGSGSGSGLYSSSSRSRYNSTDGGVAASGRKSPVIYQSRNKSNRRSTSELDTNSMHPAARALNKRANSVERVFPMRTAHPQYNKRDSSPSKDPSTTRSSSGYNRSLSDTHHSRQYGGGPDPRRLSSSVDYSSHLLSGSSDRLEDNSGGLYAERRESNSSRHSKSSSKRHSIAGEINHNNNNTMSGSNSNIYQNGSSSNSSRVYSSDEVDKIRAQYNQEIQDIKLDYQSRLLAKDRDWDKKLQACRSDLTNSQKMVMELRQKCNDMAAEFDKSMTEMLNDKEHANESGLDTSTHHHVQSLKSERDQYSDDLQQVEKSFTELHRRYDKLRESIQHHKRNEDKMKEELVDLRKQLRDSHLNFEKLREESQDKLTRAAGEVEQAKSSCKTEILRLQMALKKSEVRAQSSEQQLQQKTEENQELAQICDNLIALKGGNADEG